MTARVALSCDGLIPGGGYECRQATPVGSPRNGAVARATAHRLHRWRTARDTRTGDLLDLCPGCASRVGYLTDRGIMLLTPASSDLTTFLAGA